MAEGNTIPAVKKAQLLAYSDLILKAQANKKQLTPEEFNACFTDALIHCAQSIPANSPYPNTDSLKILLDFMNASPQHHDLFSRTSNMSRFESLISNIKNRPECTAKLKKQLDTVHQVATALTTEKTLPTMHKEAATSPVP